MRRVLSLLMASASGVAAAACAAPPDAEVASSSEEGSGLAYLRGLERKVYPTNTDRDLACPTVATPTTVGRYRPATARLSDVEVEDRLRGVVSDDLRVAVIVVKRVDGVPHYRYLSNGTADVVYQPWSSTKWIAVANAAARLREVSNGNVGLTSATSGIPLGDLVTGIETYEPKLSSSNGLAQFMHDVGGRSRASAWITDWLGRTRESFGGNYGAITPTLPLTFREPAPSAASVTITRDTASGYENQLSALTEAELLKRLVMHREDETTRLPGIQWADLRVLFYGAERSQWYPGRAFGGMSADASLYVQSGLDMEKLEARSTGTFRIFGKLGFGVPSDPARGNGEFVQVSYACLPWLDPSGTPVPDAGHEVFIAAMLGRGGSSLAQRDALFAKSHANILARLEEGAFD